VPLDTNRTVVCAVNVMLVTVMATHL
jgi:hypothetical protein